MADEEKFALTQTQLIRIEALKINKGYLNDNVLLLEKYIQGGRLYASAIDAAKKKVGDAEIQAALERAAGTSS